jgi:hypothetical protein
VAGDAQVPMKGSSGTREFARVFEHWFRAIHPIGGRQTRDST